MFFKNNTIIEVRPIARTLHLRDSTKSLRWEKKKLPIWSPDFRRGISRTRNYCAIGCNTNCPDIQRMPRQCTTQFVFRHVCKEGKYQLLHWQRRDQRAIHSKNWSFVGRGYYTDHKLWNPPTVNNADTPLQTPTDVLPGGCRLYKYSSQLCTSLSHFNSTVKLE